ncbi:VanZ like family protein [Lutibacter agarilyticus]|uniref:VanZ like family protein n=1 Tax=Lutibacter agarilyticus TaxID=1109740 RepID=A0A238VS69_9FLAO|nr:VanZ family protein [Lutibacter agarilyticus]SNR37088.1 VanZ like family protein [Lutibacter agarilyticus]
MKRNYFIYIGLFLTVLITVGSLIPPKKVVEVKVPSFDKVIHFGAYFLLALSWLLASAKKSKDVKYALTVAFLVVVYGIIIEGLQATLTTVRQADIYDILANFTGVLVALLVFSKVLQKINVK